MSAPHKPEPEMVVTYENEATDIVFSWVSRTYDIQVNSNVPGERVSATKNPHSKPSMLRISTPIFSAD